MVGNLNVHTEHKSYKGRKTHEGFRQKFLDNEDFNPIFLAAPHIQFNSLSFLYLVISIVMETLKFRDSNSVFTEFHYRICD